jgi:FlgD Ig-like domain
MRSTQHHGFRLTPLLVALALIAGVTAAEAAGFWGPDFNISGGDVNETFTGQNGQRFAATDDSNNLYIAFHDNRNKTGNDDNFEIYFRRFIYNFGSPSITRVTNAHNPSRNAALAIRNWGVTDPGTVADSGRVYLAWQDGRLFSIPAIGLPKSFTIFFRTFMSKGGEGFGPEIQVSPYDSLNVASPPVLTCGDASTVWIVYPKQENAGTNTNLYLAVYNSLTRVMGPEELLVTGATQATSPSIAATKDGVVHLVWSDNRNLRTQIWTKRFIPGSGWTPDEQLVFSSNVSTAANLVASYSGRLHVVWRDTRDGNSEIYYKEYLPATGWDPVDMRLTTQINTQSEPQIDADPIDNLYVVWTDQRNGASNPDIFYRERMGGVWQPEMSLVGAGTDTTNQVQQFPGITHDGTGKAYVTWTDWRLPASSGRNKDVFYKEGIGVVTDVETSPAPPLSRLLQSYPNPFNPLTKITFRMERDAQVSLRVYDVQGRLIRTLVDDFLAAGPRVVEWDGADDRGLPVASGTYYLRLQGGGTYLSRTINLLK